MIKFFDFVLVEQLLRLMFLPCWNRAALLDNVSIPFFNSQPKAWHTL